MPTHIYIIKKRMLVCVNSKPQNRVEGLGVIIGSRRLLIVGKSNCSTTTFLLG